VNDEEEDIEAVLEFMQLLSEYKSFEDACCAIERIVHGEKESAVLEDFGYVYYDGDSK